MDSNVFIAYVRMEIGKPFKLMFKDVENFFNQSPREYVVVLSGLALKEIEKIVHYRRESTIEFFKERKIKTEIIEVREKDKQSALKLCSRGMHSMDAMHAALAINSKCDALLTFNKKDFNLVRNLIEVKEPAGLIP